MSVTGRTLVRSCHSATASASAATVSYRAVGWTGTDVGTAPFGKAIAHGRSLGRP